MKNKILTLSFLFISLLPSCGFDKLIKKLEEQKNNNQRIGQSDSKKIFDALNGNLNSKSATFSERQIINGVIDCYNNVQPKIESIEGEYFRKLNETLQFCHYSRKVPNYEELMKRHNSYATTFSDEKTLEICKKNLQAVEANSTPYGSLLNFYKPFVSNYELLVADLAQLEPYNKQQNFKDDACALGQKLFISITDKIDQLRGKVKGVASEMNTLKRNLDLKELGEMEKKEGKKFEWFYMYFTMQAEDLLKSLHMEQNGKYNAFEYQQVFPGMDKTYQELVAYAKAHPEEEAIKQIFVSIHSEADDFYAVSKILNRDMAEGKVTVDGLNKFLSAYNSYIESVNMRVPR